MKPTRKGQIVKFHTPCEDEGPEQLYVILEYIEDGDRTRAKIEVLNTGFSFPPNTIVYVKDLELDRLMNKQVVRYLEDLEIEASLGKSIKM